MKTGWKWRFVAHLALAMLLAVPVLFIMGLLVFIFPKVAHRFHMLNVPQPEYVRSTVGFLVNAAETWFLWLPIIIIGWAVFEWRCRSENKSTIRLTVGMWASLVMMAAGVALSAVIVVPLSTLPAIAHMQQPGSIVRQHVAEADASYVQLEQAIDAKDWSRAHESSRQLYRTFRTLRDSGAAAPTLAAMHDRQNIDDVRRLVAEIAERADDVKDSVHPSLNSEVQTLEDFTRLEQSYDELRAKVQGWPPVDESVK